MNAVAANAAAHPAITPLEFMLGMMADPSVEPSLRFKAAQAAAPFVHAKPTGAPPGDSGATIIDGHRSAEDAALVAGGFVGMSNGTPTRPVCGRSRQGAFFRVCSLLNRPTGPARVKIPLCR
jgi:hypothetical protein